MRRAIAIATAALALGLLLAATAHAGHVRKYGKRTMRPGDHGADVRALQFYLSKISLPPAVDGFYGPATRHSVKAYEAVNQMPRDGITQKGEARKIRTAAKHRQAAPGGPFVFPVSGLHSFGGAANAFGAPRSGHTHQGQDVLAACGVPVVAAQGGSISVNAYQAAGAGNYVVIHGAVNAEDYMYAHFPVRSPLPVGTVVAPGAAIGSVGETGDATACHLHFEMWTVPGWHTGGHPYDPLPSLLAWDAYS
jgi:murein DD-endopeptidase MepM/ murein hydrolase activator NlpD